MRRKYYLYSMTLCPLRNDDFEISITEENISKINATQSNILLIFKNCSTNITSFQTLY